jgi:hypothetical protein
MYQQLVPETPMTLEHLVLLVMTVSQGQEFEVTQCAGCGGVVVLDRSGLRRGNCTHCNEHLSRFTSTWTKCTGWKGRLSLLRPPDLIAAG